MWYEFLATATRVLGPGSHNAAYSESWCSWTTFERLRWDAGYWQAGVPGLTELGEFSTTDGGTWGQPFRYEELAHLIIPATFYFEHSVDGEFTSGLKHQSINKLSESLKAQGIAHRITELVLEVKLY